MITLIATVLNEGSSIHRLMQSIQQQIRLPDEIIIVDGGSTDDTVQILREYQKHLPLKIQVESGCNISQGRNIALNAAQGDIIAITDAGVRLHPEWLQNITHPLLEKPDLTVVCGFFHADPQTTFETALGAATLPLAPEIDAATFLPSSRSVAVRKSAALQVQGYPEWLDYCEDLIFDLRLKATQPPFVFVPDALVYFQPRHTLAAFFKQYYRYARGDGKADLWRKRHAVRYITYLIVLPVLLWLSAAIHPIFLFVLLAGGVLYLRQPYQRLPALMQTAPDKSPLAWIQIMLWLPVIRIVGDIAKMLGYPVGWRWRLQYRPPVWKIQAEP